MGKSFDWQSRRDPDLWARIVSETAETVDVAITRNKRADAIGVPIHLAKAYFEQHYALVGTPA